MDTSSIFTDEVPAVQFEPWMKMAHKIDRLQEGLKKTSFFWKVQQEVKLQTMASGKLSPEEIKEAIDEILEDSGMKKKLKNLVHRMQEGAMRRAEATQGINVTRSTGGASRAAAAGAAPPPPLALPLPQRAGEEGRDNINAARRRWERSINEELLAMGQERGRPLARLRGGDGEDGAAKGGENNPPLRFLFDSEDLRAVITMIEPENRSRAFAPGPHQLASIKLLLDVPSLEDLQEEFKELSPAYRQAGLDDLLEGSEAFAAARLALGRRVTGGAPPRGGGGGGGGGGEGGGGGGGGGGAGLPPPPGREEGPPARAAAAGPPGEGEAVARQYAKQGVPTALRAGIWRCALGLRPSGAIAGESAHFRWLLSEGQRIDLITDDLFEMDVQFIADDDRYFVFEDMLRDCVGAFSRDAQVLRGSDVLPHQPLVGHHGEGQAPGTAVPPCGVQPFRGFCNYLAPLCFLYHDAPTCYGVARALWCRFWCRLNAVRGRPGTLLPLCKLFEDLVLQGAPDAFARLVALGVSPLSIVMPWIQFGFVGFLEPDQILLLWDRIIGFQSLHLLPVLAASIIMFRSHNILKVDSADGLRDLFQDITRLKVVPLLQGALFPAATAHARPPPPPPPPGGGGGGREGGGGGGGAAADRGGEGGGGGGGGPPHPRGSGGRRPLGGPGRGK